jgi:hypothetical protein
MVPIRLCNRAPRRYLATAFFASSFAHGARISIVIKLSEICRSWLVRNSTKKKVMRFGDKMREHYQTIRFETVGAAAKTPYRLPPHFGFDL